MVKRVRPSHWIDADPAHDLFVEESAQWKAWAAWQERQTFTYANGSTKTAIPSLYDFDDDEPRRVLVTPKGHLQVF